MGAFGPYTGRSTGRALEALRECLEYNGPPENYVGGLRNGRGLTQSKLASVSKVSQGYISEVESGSKRLSAPAAEKIGRALGVDVGVLLTFTRLGALKTALETGESRGPLTREIVACMALIAENLPDGSLKNLLMATMTEALQEAVKKDQEGAPQGEAGTPKPGAALKSKKRNPTRDQWGRRIREEAEPRAGVGLKSKQQDGRIVRDTFGVNRSKNRRPAS